MTIALSIGGAVLLLAIAFLCLIDWSTAEMKREDFQENADRHG